MEFVIEKKDLVHELQTVTGVVEKRATLPILANLLLETSDDGLRVGASDLEVTIRGTAKATVKDAGSITLPAAKLHEIARSLPDAEVRFKLLDRNQVAISCARTRYRIAGQSREEFPKFPELSDGQSMEIPADQLATMIERVAFAITTEDPRYSLNGALFQVEDGTLTLVATDGNRLAYVSSSVAGAKENLKVIVPKKALHEVYKLAGDAGEGAAVKISVDGKQVSFDVAGHLLTSSVLDGNFPKYDKVMPDACQVALEMDTQELAQAVKRVALLVTDRYGRAVRLELSPGKLKLSSETEMGEAQEEIAVEYDGPEVKIGFNARFLLDFFAAVGSSKVELQLNPLTEGEEADASKTGDKPGQFRPVGAKGIDYRYIVMPMHL